ncbi:MAG: Caulobacter phage Sansa [Verrucomicrobiota bacterium]|jgi:hypothetical protein
MLATMLTPAEEKAQAAVEKAVRRSYRSDAETAMRDVLEDWCRERYPGARLFHELVMNRGTVRADVAAIQPNHLAAFEIKGPYDSSERLIHQIAMFRLAVPELWIVTTERLMADAELVRYLLPSVGVLEVRHRDGGTGEPYSDSPWRGTVDRSALTVHVVHEPDPFAPHPEALLSLCWVAELRSEAIRHRVWQGKDGTHAALLKALLKTTPAEQLSSVCRQLRRRETLFRADPPSREEAP